MESNKILFEENYIKDEEKTFFDRILSGTDWLNAGAPRMECFMSDTLLTYGYDTKDGVREYTSIPFTDIVKDIMNKLNNDFGTDYNVCFLNYYADRTQHLGWHSDDSPTMDSDHPIGVVSFGEARYIFTKDKGFKGNIPDSDKYLLSNGSLFVMPEKYQDNHLHKIPKGDREMGGRVSLTFRRYKV